MSRPEDGDFLGRWSARKLGAHAERPRDPAAEAAEPATEPSDPDAEKTDAEILDELGLPDPDTLVKGDDFKAFLRAGVPGRLRARALRRLWMSDPVLANLDGLNDYDQDFTASAMPALKTAYQVGKGFLFEKAEEASAPTDARGTTDNPPEDMAEGAATQKAEEAASLDAVERKSGTAADNTSKAFGGQPPQSVSAGQPVARTDRPIGQENGSAEREGGAPANAARPCRMRFRFEYS